MTSANRGSTPGVRLASRKHDPRIESAEFLPHSGICFPQNPFRNCPQVGLSIPPREVVDISLIRRPRAENLGWIDELNYCEPAHAAKLNHARALLGKIDEILTWEQRKDIEERCQVRRTGPLLA